MKATFVFADDSKLSVNAFNSVKAKLAHLPNPPIKVFFDINTTDWVSGEMEGFENFQERDKQARIKWLNECTDAIDSNVKGLDKLEKSLSDVDVVNPTFEQPIIGDNGPTLKPLTEAKLQPSTLTPQQQSEFLLLQIEGKTIQCTSNLDMEELRDCYDGPGRIIPPGPKEIGKPGNYPRTFIQRISDMNRTFEVPTNNKPTDLGPDRIYKFHKVLRDEVDELLLAAPKYNGDSSDLVAYADCLGDIVVYVFSEAERWGIPLVQVLHAILDSQDSKLVDGKPLWAPDKSKFIKGPNYLPPENKIKEILDDAAIE